MGETPSASSEPRRAAAGGADVQGVRRAFGLSAPAVRHRLGGSTVPMPRACSEVVASTKVIMGKTAEVNSYPEPTRSSRGCTWTGEDELKVEGGEQPHVGSRCHRVLAQATLRAFRIAFTASGAFAGPQEDIVDRHEFRRRNRLVVLRVPGARVRSRFLVGQAHDDISQRWAASRFGDLIAFLDNDTIVHEDWLAGVVRRFPRHTVGEWPSGACDIPGDPLASQ